MFQLPGRQYEYHAPTQSPINPPYKEACELRRTDKLAKPGKPDLEISEDKNRTFGNSGNESASSVPESVSSDIKDIELENTSKQMEKLDIKS